MKQMDPFEVIVVGAGLAGLAAADELGRRRVLVLEAGARAGGKVETIRRDDGVHERGALFAFDPAWVPFPVAAGELEREDRPIGLWLDGRLIRGDTVAACLGATGADILESLSVRCYLDSPSPQAPMIGAALSRALNAFFRVIHPATSPSTCPPADATPCCATTPLTSGTATGCSCRRFWTISAPRSAPGAG